ncbi:MAG: DUF1987 domain-containing protein [Bacteroidia bacterium]|nr:DUF1987 domain-containing protein [Bacteroidia bacterium]
MNTIEATEDTPKINLDSSNNYLSIVGISAPEDAVEFYQPILDWLSSMQNDTPQEITLKFRFNYYNTATSLLTLQIMKSLDKLHKENCTTKIIWCHEEEDNAMIEAGNIYKENLYNCEFLFESYPKPSSQ